LFALALHALGVPAVLVLLQSLGPLLPLFALALFALGLHALGVPAVLVLLLPAGPRVGGLAVGSGLEILDPPVLLFFPIPVLLPGVPVLLNAMHWNPFILPWVSVPMAVGVILPPTRIYFIIKPGYISEVKPIPVVIAGPIPSAIPETPPPSDMEKYFSLDIWNGINICTWNNYDCWRSRKDDQGGQRNAYTDIHAGRQRGWQDEK